MAVVNGQACPVSGQLAEIIDGEFDGWTVTGSSTDGQYRIARSVIKQVGGLAPTTKAKIMSWIVDRHRAGEHSPMIASHTLEQIIARPNYTYDQRVARFFLLLKQMNFSLSGTLRTSGIVDEQYRITMGLLSAWLGFYHQADIQPVLSAMASEGLLIHDGSSFRLTGDGVRRLDRLSADGSGGNQAFVAMWFAEEMSSAYDGGFEPAISDNGYQALRIDKKEHSNKIDDEIIAEIRKSKFIVADFTCGISHSSTGVVGIPRGGVYYEAGFAQGLNKDVIWTVRADCIAHVHFDTRQYAHVVWSEPADLREKLRARIGAVIGQAEL